MALPHGPQKRKFMSPDRVYCQGPKACGSLFLDSGAHTLYNQKVVWKQRAHGYDFYGTKAFKRYVDQYAKFVKAHADVIDLYANVDVIFNPELSWKWQLYLEEEHGLKPVPVIHYATSLKWIDKHLDRGYDLIGIGGLGQEVPFRVYTPWADKVFTHLCPKSNGRKPVVKTHGFAMTSFKLMTRYPWWSVDSVSWAKAAGFGGLYVPHRRRGQWTFDEPPYAIGFSHRSEAIKSPSGRHYLTLNKNEKELLLDWLEEVGVALGKVDKNGRCVEYGVYSQYHARAVANLKFFDRLCKWLPAWPWAFKAPRRRKGFFDEVNL